VTSKDLFTIDNITGIRKEDRNRLISAKIYSVKDLVVRGAMNVSEAIGIPAHTCNRMCSSARTRLEELGVVNRPFKTPAHKKVERISLGSTALDGLLGGRGLHTGAVTEFFGQSNSGKTQICHTACVTVQAGKDRVGLARKALYIDTESTFTQERIRQIAEVRGLNKTKAVNNIMVAQPMNSIDQEHYLVKAGSVIDQHNNIKLLIVDSVTGLYRGEYIGRAVLAERQQRLYRYMLMLRRLSEVYRVAVVVTNQVNEIPEVFTGPFRHKPIGGNVMAHASTYRIRLRQFGSYRIAVLTHSPYLPEKQIYFGISAIGISDVPNPETLK
jgi:DNA repair protein RadA